MRSPLKTLALAITAIALTACASDGKFANPFGITPNTATYINATNDTGKPNASITAWWDRIDDDLLNAYIDQLLSQNLELKQAGERVIQAREQVNIARGGLFPAISGDASASRSFTSTNSISPDIISQRTYINSFDTGLNASWEIDLFGRIQKSIDANRATFKAAQFDETAMRQALIAELLNRRIAVAVNKRLLTLAQNTSNNRKITYDVVQNRYNLGVSNTAASDIYLAEENYTTARADIPLHEAALAEQSYRLDILLGLTPGTTDPMESAFPLLPPPLDIATCIPADLLDRRPDLMASELRLSAAKANIDIAIADLYPSINLAGGIGFGSNEASNLFSADQLAGSILSSITARLFEGGALRANIRLRESQARELAAAYAANILEAMREVETALSNEHALEAQLRDLQRSAEALGNAESTAQERYIRGIITLPEFLDIQQSRYAIDQALLTKQQQRWDARIALYLALGGDWVGQNPAINACETTPQKQDIKT